MYDRQRSIDALHALMNIIEETANEAGANGVPSGHVYIALNGAGVTLEVYNSIVNALVEKGRIRLSNHVIYGVAA